MTPASFRGALLVRLLAEAALTPRARRLLGDALAGDVEAAERLAAAVAPAVAGDLVALAFGHRMARDPFAALLAAAWQRDHHAVLAAAGTRRRVRGWFRHAAFRLPAGTPARLRVWSHGPSYRAAAEAYVWTTGRPDRSAGPVVATAVVERSTIAMRDGQRVVLLRAPSGAVVAA